MWTYLVMEIELCTIQVVFILKFGFALSEKNGSNDFSAVLTSWAY